MPGESRAGRCGIATGPVILSPADHGRRMSLAAFDTAHAPEGRRYELSRGTVVVTEVPNRSHGGVVCEIRELFYAHEAKHPGTVRMVLGFSECKLSVEPTESECHPDVAVYRTEPPAEDATAWSVWVPEIVVEVVGPDTTHHDYVEKAEDYLLFGVGEYWIVDPARSVIAINRRFRGRWETRQIRDGDTYTTHLLPCFALVAAPILRA